MICTTSSHYVSHRKTNNDGERIRASFDKGRVIQKTSSHMCEEEGWHPHDVPRSERLTSGRGMSNLTGCRYQAVAASGDVDYKASL